jgi:N-acetylmuramic acid 6-phosphate etherase
MLERLLTEQRNPASEHIDSLPTVEMLRIINEADREVPVAVGKELESIATAVDAITASIRRGGRLFYIGAGTSGRLGVLDASECPPTFSVSSDLVQGIIAGGPPALAHATEATEDDPDTGAADLLARGFNGTDILVGIAASGRTPYVIGAIRKARELGSVTIGISCTPESQLSREVNIPIEPLPGPEVIAGSTRMRAGTATKLVLNMLSTGVMIRLGHVYKNLMVNVQPKNEKLVDRSRRIIGEAASVPYAQAAELLDASGGNVKTAIVMGKLNVSRNEAERRLAEVGGRIGAAING